MRPRTRFAALLGVVVFLVLAGTGTGYAYWTASSTVTANAGATNAAVTVAGNAGLTTTYTTTSTGPVIAQLTLGNTGGAPLTLAVSGTNTNAALSGQIALRLWLRSGASCGTTIPGSGVTVGTLAAPPSLPAGATTAAAGASVFVCAATTFTGTFASYAGQTTTVTLTLTGTVGTNWTATATGAFTQNLSNAAPAFTCVNNTGSVTISWANTSTANTGTIYKSKVNGVYPSNLADRSWYYREFSNQGITGTGLPNNVAGTYPWIIEETTNGVTTTAYAGQVQVVYYAPWGQWVLQCA